MKFTFEVNQTETLLLFTALGDLEQNVDRNAVDRSLAKQLRERLRIQVEKEFHDAN